VASFPPIKITIAAVDRVTGVFRKIEGRTAGFKRAMATVGRVVAAVGAAMLALGVSAAYAGTRLVKGFIDKASGLVDAADRIGITAEAFQGLALAAEQVGVSQGQLELAMRKLVKEGGNAEEFATTFADRVAGIADPTLRAQFLVKTLGKSGQKLGPLFKDGSRGIASMVDQFRKLGAIQSEDTLRRAETLGDSFERIKAGLGGLAGDVFAKLLPSLERFSKGFEGFLADPAKRKMVIKFFEDLQRLASALAPSLETIAKAMSVIADMADGFRELRNPGTLNREETERNLATFRERGLGLDAPLARSGDVQRIELMLITEKGTEAIVTKAPRGNGRITLDVLHGPLMVGQ
jgi:phage-related protein